MTNAELTRTYENYIACLNKRDWPGLERFVDSHVSHNGAPIGLGGYRRMLQGNCEDVPDLSFQIKLLISDPPFVASRLGFDCTPTGTFLGLPVNGRRISFAENVFYEFRGERIWKVWSVIDKAAIESQLSGSGATRS